MDIEISYNKYISYYYRETIAEHEVYKYINKIKYYRRYMKCLDIENNHVKVFYTSSDNNGFNAILIRKLNGRFTL